MRKSLILLVWLSATPVDGAELQPRPDAWVAGMVGQHFCGKLSAPSFFPVLAFRTGLLVTEEMLVRLDLGLGLTRITGSAKASFDDAWLTVGDGSLGIGYSWRLGPSFTLNLGGLVGFWFSALTGENLLGGTGTLTDYLEQLSIGYGLFAGVEWDLTRRLALVFEVRGNLAMVEWNGGPYNTGGLTILGGVLYRIPLGADEPAGDF